MPDLHWPCPNPAPLSNLITFVRLPPTVVCLCFMLNLSMAAIQTAWMGQAARRCGGDEWPRPKQQWRQIPIAHHQCRHSERCVHVVAPDLGNPPTRPFPRHWHTPVRLAPRIMDKFKFFPSEHSSSASISSDPSAVSFSRAAAPMTRLTP
ncbi:hypothetical protein QBC39DRAFT_362677 [Podospora conica]|nr:hypothetical protein QBC39DRAFT_362677 [Schizothecium conicum]